jgi:Mrp family chromosome partitioning ATPase
MFRRMSASPVTRRAANVVRRGRRLAVLAVGIAAAAGGALVWLSWSGVARVPVVPAIAAVLTVALASSALLGLMAELQRPRIADLDEAARAVKATGFGVVRPQAQPAPAWAGRRATWEVADDPWQLALAAITPLAGAGAWVLVSGDEPVETGASAALLARAASEESRSTLLVDTDPVARAASTTFRPTPGAGVAEVVADGRPWDEVLQAAYTGEFRALDVVAPGAAGRARAPRLDAQDQAALRATSARYGLTILTLPDVAALTAAGPNALARSIAILVAVRGVTSVASLRRRAAQLADAGATVAGVLLWDDATGG